MRLRQACRRLYGRHPARTKAVVIAQPVDIDSIAGRVGLDLELNGLPSVGTDRSCKALDACIALPVHLPLRGRVSRSAVLYNNRIAGADAGCDRRERPGGVGGQSVASEILHARISGSTVHHHGVGRRTGEGRGRSDGCDVANGAVGDPGRNERIRRIANLESRRIDGRSVNRLAEPDSYRGIQRNCGRPRRWRSGSDGRRCVVGTRGYGVENNVDPVVGRLIAVRGKRGAAAVLVQAISAAFHVAEKVQRVDGYSAACKILPGVRVAALRSEIGGHIDRVRRDRDRAGEIHLLPTGRCFVRKRRRRQARARRGPKVAYMCSGVARALVETYARDVTVDVRAEFDAEFDRIRVGRRYNIRHRGFGPNVRVERDDISYRTPADPGADARARGAGYIDVTRYAHDPGNGRHAPVVNHEQQVVAGRSVLRHVGRLHEEHVAAALELQLEVSLVGVDPMRHGPRAHEGHLTRALRIGLDQEAVAMTDDARRGDNRWARSEPAISSEQVGWVIDLCVQIRQRPGSPAASDKHGRIW